MQIGKFYVGRTDRKKIEPPISGLTWTAQGLLFQILRELRELRSEVRAMADEKSLDQAVDDLGGAVTGKIAEDQVLRQQAAEGRNDAADIQKVEDLAGQLNAETAAETAEANPPAPAPTPAPAPAPTDGTADGTTANVTVTGETAQGQTVPDAPVDNSAAAPATQQVPVPNTTTQQ